MRSELIGAGIAAPAIAQGTFINVYTQKKIQSNAFVSTVFRFIWKD